MGIRFDPLSAYALTCLLLPGSTFPAGATPVAYSRAFPYPGTPLAIVLDSTGSAYVAGNTTYAGLPTSPGAVQSSYAGGTCPGGTFFGNPLMVPCEDVFIAKLDGMGHIKWLTYLGGSGNDTLAGIALDTAGNILVGGTTTSVDFPITTGAFQRHLAGSSDAFVAKLDASGTHLLYATYVGGSSGDTATGLAVDGFGNAYASGALPYRVTSRPARCSPLLALQPVLVSFSSSTHPGRRSSTQHTFTSQSRP
jgi:hypothetical protein